MIFPFLGTAPWRAVSLAITVAGLSLTVSCASYSRKPLIADEYREVLGRRSATASEVVEAVGNTAYAPEDGVSLQEAELLTLYLNPRLRTARLNAGIPAASARFAGLWADPEIGADAMRVLQDVEEPWLYGASLSFTIPISGRLAVAKTHAEAKARAALIEAWSEELQVLLELRQAWANWESANRSLTVSQHLLKDLSELVSVTNSREELGELIAAEAVAFRLAEARLRLENDQLRADEVEARFQVLELMGLLPTSEVMLSLSHEEVSAEAALANLTDGSAVFQRSPAILLAAARYEAAEERLRLEVRKQYPDLSLGPLYANEEGTDRLGLGFSLPIPILNANKQGIAEANAERDAARATWEQAVQETIAALARNDAALLTSLRRHEAIRSTLVPLAKDQIVQARNLADLGEINTFLILDALESEREAALDLIKAQATVERVLAERHFALPDAVPSFDLHKEEQE